MTDERRVLRLQGGPVEIDEVAGFGGSDDGIGNGQERFFGRAAGIGADGGAGSHRRGADQRKRTSHLADGQLSRAVNLDVDEYGVSAA